MTSIQRLKPGSEHRTLNCRCLYSPRPSQEEAPEILTSESAKAGSVPLRDDKHSTNSAMVTIQ